MKTFTLYCVMWFVICGGWHGLAAQDFASQDFASRGFTSLRQSDLVERFHDICAARASAAREAGNITVIGRKGWLFLDRELQHLSAGPITEGPNSNPLPAILDFKKQLERAGIELLIVPVPPKAVIYPSHLVEGIAGELPRFDPHHQEFYDTLERNGIPVLDLVPLFLSNRDNPKLGPLYCKRDSHWSGQACILAAREIAKQISGREWLDQHQEVALETRIDKIRIIGDLEKSLSGVEPMGEKIRLRIIGQPDGKRLRRLQDDDRSPVVLLGDSHNLVFHVGGDDMHASGGGLADQLAFELGMPIDVVAVRGSGATPSRINLLRNARKTDYLSGKKLVIWCLSAREFTDSDWRKVPVVD